MSEPVYIFISPHLDDVVFSCGGYVYQLASQGYDVVIVTVVTKDDESGLPPTWLAQRNLRSWGEKKGVFVMRCAEDLEAARKLGAKVLHLGLLDCIFRRDADQRPLYNERVVNVPVHEHDRRVFKRLLEKHFEALLKNYGEREITVVCPLSIGGHVDHMIVREAVETVTTAQQRLYYEDFPYILRLGSSEAKTKNLVPVTIKLFPEDINARLAASACYHSQISGLFPAKLDVILEILRARIPLIGQYIPIRSNLKQAVHRMEIFIRDAVQQVKGERYWTNGNHISNTNS